MPGGSPPGLSPLTYLCCAVFSLTGRQARDGILKRDRSLDSGIIAWPPPAMSLLDVQAHSLTQQFAATAILIARDSIHFGEELFRKRNHHFCDH